METNDTSFIQSLLEKDYPDFQYVIKRNKDESDSFNKIPYTINNKRINGRREYVKALLYCEEHCNKDIFSYIVRKILFYPSTSRSEQIYRFSDIGWIEGLIIPKKDANLLNNIEITIGAIIVCTINIK